MTISETINELVNSIEPALCYVQTQLKMMTGHPDAFIEFDTELNRYIHKRANGDVIVWMSMIVDDPVKIIKDRPISCLVHRTLENGTAEFCAIYNFVLSGPHIGAMVAEISRIEDAAKREGYSIPSEIKFAGTDGWEFIDARKIGEISNG